MRPILPLVLSLFLSFSCWNTLLTANAQILPDELQGPQCTESQLVNGLCFTTDMPRSLGLAGSKAFQVRFGQTVAAAQQYLDTLTPSPQKVIITDLDETLLSNTAYYKTHEKWTLASWQEWIQQQESIPGPYNTGVRDLLQTAKSRGFSVMFITGRPPVLAKDTLCQVRDIVWDGMYFKPASKQVLAGTYKSAVRQFLRNLGYDIVLNIGDQPSDMDLPVESDKGEFQLPNVIYSIP